MLWSKVTAVRFAVRGTDKADSFLKVFEMEEIKAATKRCGWSTCTKKCVSRLALRAMPDGGKFDRRDFPGFFNKEKKQDDEKNSSRLFDKL